MSNELLIAVDLAGQTLTATVDIAGEVLVMIVDFSSFRGEEIPLADWSDSQNGQLMEVIF